MLAGLVGLATVALACEPSAPKAPFTYAAFAAPGECVDWRGQPVERTCVPRVARADEPLVLEMEGRCGACGTTIDACDVAVDGRVVTISLDGKACEPAAGLACSDTCAKRRVRCEIPPLTAARYQVRYGDTSGRVDILEVADVAGAATACVLGREAPAAPHP